MAQSGAMSVQGAPPPQIISLQLIVAASPKCIEVLRYLIDISENFAIMGIKVVAIKVPKDSDKLQPLRRLGVTSTPTIIAPGNKLIVGVAAIKKLFETNMKKIVRGNAPGGGAAMDRFTRTGDEVVNDYMTSCIMDGAPRGRNNMYRQDDQGDEDDDDDGENIARSGDLNARMKAWESRRKVRIQNNFGDEDNADDATPRRNSRRSRRSIERATGNDEFEDEDRNVGDDDDAPQMTRRSSRIQPPPRQKNRYSGKSASQIDDMMVEALMENTLAQ